MQSVSIRIVTHSTHSVRINACNKQTFLSRLAPRQPEKLQPHVVCRRVESYEMVFCIRSPNMAICRVSRMHSHMQTAVVPS